MESHIISPEGKTPIRPVLPVAPYIGGKRALAKRLTAIIDNHDHHTYAEPFVGMGGVFFRRSRRAPAELMNDWSQDVATLFRILQRHYVAFMDMLKYQLTTRTEFERLLNVPADTLTDLERAARFLYLQRVSFGGKVNGRTFGFSHGRPARFDLTKLQAMMEDVHERLAGVTIERKPFDQFIERYDRTGVLFFIDPPYWGNETDYGEGMFSRDHFAVLKGVLEPLKGSFVMTLNDRSEVREMFGGFDIKAVDLHYSVGAGIVPAKEVIISRLR
ncbi:DNA adenine methylase [Asticcacaulis sp. AND118]|uniref:DNA adenine methylase n=1 Tax=Asticcacaulis sp. AND118 TaxID=2840468 RepID=UPI001CFF9559|nr:DNA adenine methylase [Asticcacaulis sp. AND118]UDF02986.1 DNA adenine methylase [Asticcacaulis sp. AND118]